MLPMSLPRLLLLAATVCPAGRAQTATLRGQVTDESGAIVPGARITVTGPVTRTAAAANAGGYTITGLPPGDYTVQSAAPQLMLAQPVRISLKAGAETLNLSVAGAAERQQVTVSDPGAQSVSTDAAANASATVLRGTDLDALPDD